MGGFASRLCTRIAVHKFLNHRNWSETGIHLAFNVSHLVNAGRVSAVSAGGESGVDAREVGTSAKNVPMYKSNAAPGARDVIVKPA